MNDDWVLANSWRVLDRPEYTFDIEEWRNGASQMVFIHFSILTWTKSVLKRALAEFAQFRALTDAPLYATSDTSDEKWQRFVSLFGFTHLIDAEDGRKIFISRNSKNNGQLRHIKDDADQ